MDSSLLLAPSLERCKNTLVLLADERVGREHGQQHTRSRVIPFQVLLAYKPVLNLNLLLTSRDLFSSHLTLALPSEYHQRPHVYGLITVI